MNVQELRYVVAVAQAGSINKAALNLYVSQSTLSRAVQEVEAQIGISLFQRTNKGAIPTHDGLEFIERARRLLLAFDQLEGQYLTTRRLSRRRFWSPHSAARRSFRRLSNIIRSGARTKSF